MFLHHATESVVLAVRGTGSFKDVVTDVMADEVMLRSRMLGSNMMIPKVPFLGGFAHRGIVDGAGRILDRAGQEIADALRLILIIVLGEIRFNRNHPGYRLMLTGHSLGGGIVNILALQVSPLLIPHFCCCEVYGRFNLAATWHNSQVCLLCGTTSLPN